MAVSRSDVGCHLAGSELWLNIGWNTEGNQEIPSRVPEELRMFGIRPPEWTKFADALRRCADRHALPTNMTTWMVYFSFCCPCCWCFCCPYIISKKYKFDNAMEGVVERFNQQAPWENSIKFVYCERALSSVSGEIWPPLGYNIVFQLSNMKSAATGIPRVLTFTRTSDKSSNNESGIFVSRSLEELKKTATTASPVATAV